MRIRLISTKLASYYGPNFVMPLPSLSIMHLGAITPKGIEVQLIDERMDQKIPIDKKADLIGITVMTGTHYEAFDIADKYREIGMPVVLGGFHPTLFEEESIKHADCIISGEAEGIWEEMLFDFQNGKLKKRYQRTSFPDLSNLPVPLYDKFPPKDYNNVIPISITRGCPYVCSFCSVQEFFGPVIRKRPINDVVEQINFLSEKYGSDDIGIPLTFFFVDDNTWGNLAYAKELFKGLIPLGIQWSGPASVTLDDELISLAAASGCQVAFIGFESLNPANLKYLNKKHNKVDEFEVCVRKMHDNGVGVLGFYMVGLPHDEENCFDELRDFIQRVKMDVVLCLTYTPVPGTPQFKRLDWEGAHDTNDFRTVAQTVPIFKPKGMTKQIFKHKYIDFLEQIYHDDLVLPRLDGNVTSFAYILNKLFESWIADPQWREWASD